MKYEITKKDYPTNTLVFVRNEAGELIAKCSVNTDFDKIKREKIQNKLYKICRIYNTSFEYNNYYYYLNKIKNNNF